MTAKAPQSGVDGIEVVLNGERVHIPADATVAGLLAERRLPERGVAVEVDGEIVPRSAWANRTLMAGERIEIVHMVGGG